MQLYMTGHKWEEILHFSAGASEFPIVHVRDFQIMAITVWNVELDTYQITVNTCATHDNFFLVVIKIKK